MLRMHHENLWAPWRLTYLRDLLRRADEMGGAEAAAEGARGSFLARYWAEPEKDRENHVVYRNAHGMVMLNRYPYANGHLLVTLGDARPRLLDYDADQRAEFWRLVEIAAEMMETTLNPQGINIGINQGLAAGAGIAEHMHAHLVPRWNGDTNFITVVGQVRVIPDSLEKMAEEYREKRNTES
jgi:ATP adenylyltransferase